MLSARLIVSALTVVVVPVIVRLPAIATLPEKSPSTPSNDREPPETVEEIVEST